MKRACLSFLCALLVAGIGAGSVRAAETVFETSLVTSTLAAGAARVSVKLAEDGDPVALSDGDGTIDSGNVTIEKNGDVVLEVVGASPAGTAFLLINQGDADSGGAERDFVFSASFIISGGEVGEEDVELGTIPPGAYVVEDMLITVLLDSGDQGEPDLLDETDTILAVPGFTIEEEGDEEPPDEEPPDEEIVDIEKCLCDGKTEWDNHGQFVSCVAQAVLDNPEIIAESPNIISEAAKSDCGKPEKEE